VQEILVKPGDTVKVGDLLMAFENGEEPAVSEPEKAAPAKEAAPASTQPVEVPSVPAERPAPETGRTRETGPVPASPATRRLARELGIDLRMVPSTGPAGLVTADDVRAFAEKGKPGPAVPAGPQEEARAPGVSAPAVLPLPDFTKWGPVDRIQMRSIRRATAKQMSLAWSQIPHVHNQNMVDMTALESFRQRHKAEIAEKGGKLTITVFALKAVATALKTYPKFNATLDTQAEEIIIKHYYNIGVAVNTEDGLIVPVVRDVDRKSITDLAIELNDLVQRTRARKATVEEMQGGTFTITNVGPMGGGFFAPIINYPQVAILGMGSSTLKPVVKEKEGGGQEIVPRLMMPIVLCIDHRVLDGADAMEFMRVMMNVLEDPDELLMHMI
jgi:pyruvate dehydrogenase E2 component (dihydrolipoamide acetyltransferase)